MKNNTTSSSKKMSTVSPIENIYYGISLFDILKSHHMFLGYTLFDNIGSVSDHHFTCRNKYQ
jgi:hypothetical protein